MQLKRLVYTTAPTMLLIAHLLLVNSCAQVAELSGGERDTMPPELISTDPLHLSTNFTGNRITLVFNERIQLERMRERLLVSPPLTTPPVVRLTGSRTVTIDINGPLRPNTTYSFGVGDAVKDLTEGNAAVGVTHVFSTGATLDSMQIAGRVEHSFTGAPENEVLVMVYDINDTTAVRTGRPTYATRTNAQGMFNLQYLRAGAYRLYALRDKNSNYRYDLPNEEIAFWDTTVMAELPDTALTPHTLRLFQEHTTVQQVREARVTPDGAFRLLFSRPAEQVRIRDIARTGGQLQWIEQWGRDRDSLLLWPSDTTALTEGRYEISTEDGIVDTIRYRSVERMPFFTGLNAAIQEQPDGPVVRIRAARPILTTDSTRFSMLLDSIPLTLDFVRDSLEPRTLYLIAPLEQGDRVTLKVLPRGIVDIYGGHNDTLSVGLGRAAGQSTGILQVNLTVHETATGPFLLQLLGPQGVILQEEKLDDLQRTVTWERLPPGMVDLRLIEDRNNNGRWDPGMLDEGIQPEKVWRNPERVNIRASWDLGVDWVIGQRPDRIPGEEELEP